MTLLLSSCGDDPPPTAVDGTTTMLLSTTTIVSTTTIAVPAGSNSSTSGPSLPSSANTAAPEPTEGLFLTPVGLGPLALGMTEAAAADTNLIDSIGPGCEPSGSRSALLSLPLVAGDVTGSVDFLDDKLDSILVTQGVATEEGVIVGDSLGSLESVYASGATVTVDRTIEDTFGIWLVSVALDGSGTYGMVVDPATERVASLAVPAVPLCD